MGAHAITMLGTGFIGDFYARTLKTGRTLDEVRVAYSRTPERGMAFCERWGIHESSTDLKQAIEHPETDVIVVGLPNHLHEEARGPGGRGRQGSAVHEAAGAQRGRGGSDPRQPSSEPACSPATSRTCATRRRRSRLARSRPRRGDRRRDLGAIPGDPPRPPLAWFWDGRLTGGGAIVDLGCHCIEIIRNFVGKGNRPVEVMCWTDTFVHPIEDEDNAIALIRFESGAIGQFEVSWTFRGGMDLRDEVAGTDGTIWLNHFLRTGYEMFTAGGSGGYVAEKAESEKGWLFPVGDEVGEFGLRDMFADMFDAMDEGRSPRRRSTTATSSTPSWTPAIGRQDRRHGSRSTSSGAVAPRHGSGERRQHLRRPHRDQVGDPPRRPAQTDPQGQGQRRLRRSDRRRRVSSRAREPSLHVRSQHVSARAGSPA